MILHIPSVLRHRILLLLPTPMPFSLGGGTLLSVSLLGPNSRWVGLVGLQPFTRISLALEREMRSSRPQFQAKIAATIVGLFLLVFGPAGLCPPLIAVWSSFDHCIDPDRLSRDFRRPETYHCFRAQSNLSASHSVSFLTMGSCSFSDSGSAFWVPSSVGSTVCGTPGTALCSPLPHPRSLCMCVSASVVRPATA